MRGAVLGLVVLLVVGSAPSLVKGQNIGIDTIAFPGISVNSELDIAFSVGAQLQVTPASAVSLSTAVDVLTTNLGVMVGMPPAQPSRTPSSPPPANTTNNARFAFMDRLRQTTRAAANSRGLKQDDGEFVQTGTATTTITPSNTFANSQDYIINIAFTTTLSPSASVDFSDTISALQSQLADLAAARTGGSILG